MDFVRGSLSVHHCAARRALTNASAIAVIFGAFAFGLISPASTPAAELTAEGLFDTNRLHEVNVTIPEKEWDELRKQNRPGGFAGAISNPTQKPFTYFKGDVTVDGVSIPSVGLRKKGFIGSLDEDRPSLKVKFGEYVDQSPVDGLDRLTLNNNKQDTALVSQYLTYSIFNAAGVNAPRVSFANVTVNGKHLGVYSHVESVKPLYLEDRFGDGSGNLYEGTLSDFYPKALANLEIKTNKSDHDFSKATRLAELLSAEGDLDFEAVDKLVDIDNFLKFWAIESLLGFWDGYTQNQNNYFVYENPKNGKLYFMPWGADSCFTAGGGPFARFGGGTPTASVRAESMLANRLFHAPGIPDRYKKALQDVLDNVWKEDKLIAEIDRIEKVIGDNLHEKQKGGGGERGWGGRRLTMDGVRDFIRERREQVTDEFEDWPVAVREEPRRPMYTVHVGTAEGSFETHWSDKTTDGDPDGKTEIALRIGDKALQLVDVTIDAHPMDVGGFGRGRRGQSWTPPATIEIKGKNKANDKDVALSLMIDQKLLVAHEGESKSKTVTASGSFSEGARRGWGGPPGQMVRATLDLTSTGTTDGDLIAGKLTAQIVEMHGGFMDRGRRGGGDRGNRGDRGRSERNDRDRPKRPAFD